MSNLTLDDSLLNFEEKFCKCLFENSPKNCDDSGMYSNLNLAQVRTYEYEYVRTHVRNYDYVVP